MAVSSREEPWTPVSPKAACTLSGQGAVLPPWPGRAAEAPPEDSPADTRHVVGCLGLLPRAEPVASPRGCCPGQVQ